MAKCLDNDMKCINTTYIWQDSTIEHDMDVVIRLFKKSIIRLKVKSMLFLLNEKLPIHTHRLEEMKWENKCLEIEDVVHQDIKLVLRPKIHQCLQGVEDEVECKSRV